MTNMTNTRTATLFCDQVAANAMSAEDRALVEEQVAEYEREQQLLRKAHPRKEHQLLHRLGECDGKCMRFSIFR